MELARLVDNIAVDSCGARRNVFSRSYGFGECAFKLTACLAGSIANIDDGAVVSAGPGGEADGGGDVCKRGTKQEELLREDGDERTLGHGLDDYMVRIAAVVTVSARLQHK